MKKALALLALSSPALAQGVSASLVAQDAITVTLTDPATNTVVAQQSQSAGPLTSTNLQVLHGSYSCAIAPLGQGVQLQATTFVTSSSIPPVPSAHADLLLTLAGTGTVSLELDLAHAGDGADPLAFTVDLSNDGTVECATAPYGEPRNHRLWAWDFGGGSLQVRIRTDHAGWAGAQQYWLTLTATPWVAAARPAASGCSLIARVADHQVFETESTNYGLAALPSLQGLATLRAFGLGVAQLFVVSTVGTVSQPLPSLPLLDVIVFMVPGAVVDRTGTGVGAIPRAWEFTVPPLPPGLTFFVQHASALVGTLVQQAGTTNVIRFDT